MPFLYGDLCHSVALPPLDVPIPVDQMVGPIVRSFRTEPITDPMPQPEREAEPAPIKERVR